MMNMKKMFILIMLLLAGCVSPSTNPFVYDENCPRLCWLGINPGSSTVEEANDLLHSSNAVDKNSFQASDNSILIEWLTGRPDSFPCTVNLEFKEDLVDTISFGEMPYKMYEFLSLLGEPDKISIRTVVVPDAKYIEYFVFFNKSKTLLHVSPGDQNGPDPNDRVFGLILNSKFSEEILPSGSGDIQDWLGYGHITDYLQDQ